MKSVFFTQNFIIKHLSKPSTHLGYFYFLKNPRRLLALSVSFIHVWGTSFRNEDVWTVENRRQNVLHNTTDTVVSSVRDVHNCKFAVFPLDVLLWNAALHLVSTESSAMCNTFGTARIIWKLQNASSFITKHCISSYYLINLGSKLTFQNNLVEQATFIIIFKKKTCFVIGYTRFLPTVSIQPSDPPDLTLNCALLLIYLVNKEQDGFFLLPFGCLKITAY